jgi:hypothetical protein
LLERTAKKEIFYKSSDGKHNETTADVKIYDIEIILDEYIRQHGRAHVPKKKAGASSSQVASPTPTPVREAASESDEDQ